MKRPILAAPPSAARRDFLRTGLGALGAAMSTRLLGCSDENVDPARPATSGTGGGTGAGGAGVGGTGGVGGGSCAGGGAGPLGPALSSNLAAVGPLATRPDANGLLLPPGFTGRVIGVAEKESLPGRTPWHVAPDGGATFATPDGGWIYVSNSEIILVGGVGAAVFSPAGELVDTYRILTDTSSNCAGGKTPWQTWLSCEETETGHVWECDPFGLASPVVRPALGVFRHEAVAVDPANQHLYLTEDQKDGRFYRYEPDGLCAGFADLTKGTLSVAEVAEDGTVAWHPVPDPGFTGRKPTRMQVRQSTAFNGGEGIAHYDGTIFFSTKGDNRVWAYDIAAGKMSIHYDAATAANPILTGVDNVTVTCCGDVVVAEDGGDMQVVAILADGTLKPLVQIVGHDKSEITGPAFDPSGTRLYFSSQRAPGGGTTYEVTGPFHLPA